MSEHERAIVTEHCREAYRRHTGQAGEDDAAIDDQIRRAIDDGRHATLKQARDILAAQEAATSAGRPFWRADAERKGRVSFVLAGDLCFVVGRDRGGSGELVVVTCWPIAWAETKPD